LGTTSPLDFFHVAFSDSSGGLTGYAVQNLASGSASYSGMLFYDQNGTLGQFQGFNNSTHEYRINNIASGGSINFMLGSSKFKVRSDGDIDIAGNIRKGGTLFLQNLGTQNTSLGLSALFVNTGSNNTADGYHALMSNTSGGSNTAMGTNALASNTSGSNNTALGANAGLNLTTTSNNVMIANQGVAGDSATIRIGDSNQTRAFIAGIRGVTIGSNGVPVLIDSNGQLGTTSSSRRFKTDIRDMGDLRSDLLKLRPVTFHYKQQPIGRLEYGLIAEEVAEIYPDLVVTGKDGQVETIQYQKLTPMLLNAFQREHIEIEDEIRQKDEMIRQQEEINQRLRSRLAALEALITGKVRN
jgi:hypothetical protein